MTDIYAEAMTQKGREIVRKIQAGEWLSNLEFDSMYPDCIKRFSRNHWTPVDVAICAATMLRRSGAKRILDVGCGPGKFCIVAAALGDMNISGVDRRAHLLTEAELLAGFCDLKNLEFIHSDMSDIDWSSYDGFYLFNPFLENVCKTARIDNTVDLNGERYHGYVDTVMHKLLQLPIGTRVVTYHGFGGEFPSHYSLEHDRFVGTGQLECWRKVRHSADLSVGDGDQPTLLAQRLNKSK